MDFAGFARLQHEAGLRAGAGADEVVVQARDRKQCRDRHMVAVDAAIAEDDDVFSFREGLVGIGEKSFQRLLKRARSCRGLEKNRDGDGAEILRVHMPDLIQGGIVDDRLVELDHAATLGRGVEEVGLGTQHRRGRSDNFLADRVDRRVGDLREELLEVVVEKNRLVGEHRKRGVRAHRADGLNSIPGHWAEDHALVFKGVTKRLLALEDRLVIRQVFGRRLWQVREQDMVLIEPLTVGARGADFFFDLFVGNDAALRGIHEEHLAGLHPAFFDDVFGGDG